MTNLICKLIYKYENVNFIITYPNFDIGHDYNQKVQRDFKKPNVIFHKSLGDKLYLSSLKHCDVMIGNSSSGFTEAPYFNTPVVNIGDRQKGRPISKI